MLFCKDTNEPRFLKSFSVNRVSSGCYAIACLTQPNVVEHQISMPQNNEMGFWSCVECMKASVALMLECACCFDTLTLVYTDYAAVTAQTLYKCQTPAGCAVIIRHTSRTLP